MSDKVSLQVPITKELHRQIKHEAINADVPLRQWVINALAHYANAEGKKRHGHQGD